MITSPLPLLRSLMRAPSSAIHPLAALGARMPPVEFVLRPAAVRLLAYGRANGRGRDPNSPRASSGKTHLLLRRDDDGTSFSPRAWNPSNSFSALATWRSHPFFAHTPPTPHRHLLFPFQDLLVQPMEWEGRHHRSHSPRYEINDTDDTYEVVLELPAGATSLKEDNLKIHVDESSGALSIVGKIEKSDDGGRLRFSSSFAQTFYLDPAVDASQMKATLDDKGILTVSAPKDPSRVHARTRSIPVTAIKSAKTDLQDESDDIESTKHEGIVEDKAA